MPKSKARETQMGMFSWECKGCDQDLVTGELVRLNGRKGEYDGYGDIGGDCQDYEPAAWHQKCYAEATDLEKLNETPSKHARNQGFGYARQDCMPEGSTYVEPPRLYFRDVSSVDVRVYLDALHDEEMRKPKTPFWFNAARHGEEAICFSPVEQTAGDYAETYAAFGDRWEHNVMDSEYLPGGGRARDNKEAWGEHDLGDTFWAMLDRFQGKHEAVSTVAYAILFETQKRLRAKYAR
jgi:hypothetical protein